MNHSTQAIKEYMQGNKYYTYVDNGYQYTYINGILTHITKIQEMLI